MSEYSIGLTGTNDGLPPKPSPSLIREAAEAVVEEFNVKGEHFLSPSDQFRLERLVESAIKAQRAEERRLVYQEIADEFHPPENMCDSAKSACAQLEALFLRRAQPPPPPRGER